MGTYFLKCRFQTAIADRNENVVIFFYQIKITYKRAAYKLIEVAAKHKSKTLITRHLYHLKR